MTGVLALNKAAGITSFQAVREVRRALGERRVGHAGTLDPVATGLLPICVGRATRFVDYFHRQPKRYRCVVALGETSPTHDREGAVTRTGDASALTPDDVAAALPPFIGRIMQTPPMHSAVRHEGRHLYEIARAGEEVERTPREIDIYSVDIVGFEPGDVPRVHLDVLAGKGAYMRVLAADLGTALGVGGLLDRLERTAYGGLTLDMSVTLEELAAADDPAALLLPVEVAVDTLPRVDLAPPLAIRVQRGQAVFVPRLPDPRPQGECRAHGPDGGLVAIGDLQGNMLRPTKVLAPA